MLTVTIYKERIIMIINKNPIKAKLEKSGDAKL